MRDIFISHSSLDKSICESVCELFESYGFSCWVAYRPNNLPPGENYTNRIKTAIDSSKVFVLLVSRNSLSSEQIMQEVALANERQKYGLRIFSIIIDESVTIDEFKDKMGYVFSAKQSAFWDQKESIDELTNQIHIALIGEHTSEKAEITSTNSPPIHLIGREQEMDDILQLLKQNGKLCLSGMGGIGKTAILQFMCNEVFPQYYATIIYLSIDKCLLRTIDNDEKLKINNESIQEKRKVLSDYEYAVYKLKLLENSVNNSTLIIIDNMESEKDPFLDRICDLNCDIIIATRFKTFYRNGFKIYPVKEIKNRSCIHELFEEYYGVKIDDDELKSVDKLLNHTRLHTMTVILFAKQMRYFGKKPSDYISNNQLRYERTRNLGQIMGDTLDSDVQRMYSQLFDLFDVEAFSGEEKAVLKTLCLLPSEGIYRHLYIEIIGDEYSSCIQSLEQKGWLYSDDDSMIVLHPLVRDVVFHEFEIFFDDPDIKRFITNFISMISNAWGESFEKNQKFKELALSIYYQFPAPSTEHYKKYLVLSKYLWTVNCLELSIEIQNKIKQLFVNNEGKHIYTSDEAETLMQIGLTYQQKADYRNAYLELENAAKIFANRYAASLSHLAQAYMKAKNKPFDQIEQLYKQSLEIRQQFWSNTISEAASCHLYAKALSEYQVNLTLAIELEKRAYKLFSSLQPGHINVSSAAYILGWLYVQTAEDLDDIEFGIQKLLEAKNIRLKGREKLHPWFEDIYLKLGLAYQKAGQMNEAKDYFELLLQVREKKYSDVTDEKPITEAYQLLQTVYEALDDTEGIRKCKKYLKYHL